MNVIQLIRSLFLVVFVPMIALVGLLMCVGTIFNELRIERTLRASHGSAWQLQYEEIHGSLSDARTRVAVSCIGVVTITALTIWVIKLLGGSARGRTKKRSQEQYASSLERIMAYRRKALPRIYFGLAGIIVAVLLVVFRFGIFAERENE